MNGPLEQQAFLERISQSYRRESPQDDIVRRQCVQTFEPWLDATQSGLEIGCSDGQMSELLAQRLNTLDVVEASATFLQALERRGLDNVTAHHGLIEQFRPTRRYQRIFATWVLTHLPDPTQVLTRLKDLLAPDGLLFVVVPNARSLSRQLALHMGLVGDLYELTENDRNHGHRRAYDRARLDRETRACGYDTVAQGGLMLKILADYQMDQLYRDGMLNGDHVEGFRRLGLEYPDLSSAIYSVCRVRP
ncbi:class I SAM-dependent methyltransferase [Methylogaea oryzae]|uniref:SAM-dependent methyltransferase n=1 Tax=Methylogaea oryzae TaxID=1295382 RepID=A0A8D5AK99_9GAMM|nr:class I SAM-dependent methyltransferase [Methylogaea oryzae]BBL71579.1 SAM-dependent methyltransferase [Methylogaea oryzae]